MFDADWINTHLKGGNGLMMPSFGRVFSARVHRRIALTMAVVLLAAGIAQASHYHKSEPTRGADTHLQCLLCLYSASSAGPATVARLTDGTIIVRTYCLPPSVAYLRDADPVSYEARGPPLV
jgi:hypothetical protein